VPDILLLLNCTADAIQSIATADDSRPSNAAAAAGERLLKQ
jgi:hypothetical protein